METQHPIWLPLANDMHTHLRQENLMKTVTPLILQGGCGRVLVMPNTYPPITSCKQALDYYNQLKQIEPNVQYLMTLYLTDEISLEDVLQNANKCHVTGIKSYPKGVTTNSDQGVNSYEKYYKLFEIMQNNNLILHLHSEHPNSSPFTAEIDFIPQIKKIANDFPQLKLVMEHITTKNAVEFVKSTSNVAATITAHHLEITMDDVFDINFQQNKFNLQNYIKNPHNFCKPIAKTLQDKQAIRDVVKENHPRFFLGSDSAPHRKKDKEGNVSAAGVFTQPLLINYILQTFHELNCIQNLENFVCKNAAAFFNFSPPKLLEGELAIKIDKVPTMVPSSYHVLNENDNEIIPFLANKMLDYKITICKYIQ